MGIKTIRHRPRELGRIRTGEKRESKTTGREYPAKLDRFRFTSTDKAVIESVAALYGGAIQPWDNNGRAEWQVIIDSPTVAVQLPPLSIPAYSQWYELWGRGIRKRRCDGLVCHESQETDDGAQLYESPCICEVAGGKRECTPQTRGVVDASRHS